MDIRGMTLSAWVNLQISEGSTASTECSLGGRGGGSFGPSQPLRITPDRWTRLRIDLDPVDLNGAMEVGYFYVSCDFGEGVVYIDDVSLE